jgi:hypothetical protein
MILLLLLSLAFGDDAAVAGAAYREAQDALRLGRCEDAVAKLQEALRAEPKETEKLLYRDREGRHREAYYPHYVWSQARTLQARGEANPTRRRDLLREAQAHLELTEHPGAAGLLETVKAELAAVKNPAPAPPPDAPLVPLRRRVLELCDRDLYEEAARALAAEAALLERFPAERATLLETLENQRRSTLRRYDQAMTLALETIAASSWTGKPDSVPLLLRPALVPPSVSEKPDPRFVWLRDFLTLYERELPTLRAWDRQDAAAAIRCAGGFEESAFRAFEAGSFPGFRAAHNIADTLRSAKMSGLDAAHADPQLDLILGASEKALQRREAYLSRASGSSEEIESYKTETLATAVAALRRTRENLEERRRLRDDFDQWMLRGSRALSDPTSMSNPAALKTIAREGAPFEGTPAWKELPAGRRAVGLYLRGILELMAGILEGEAAGPLRERLEPVFRNARAMDPNVATPWKDRLSPKILDWPGERDQ